MKIIGAGFGRTGTTSLQAALELLGCGPCYHMTEVLKKPAHAATWLAAALGQPVDFRALLKDYQSTVDAPGFALYKELLASFPEAKVLLSVRDPERWYDSTLATIYAISKTWPMSWLGRFMPGVGPVFHMADKLIWQGVFHGRFLDRAYAIEVFHRHNEAVKKAIPAERLLVFDVKQGWEPLCQFLGVPVPEGVPFPHLNDTADFTQRIRRMRLGSSAFLAVGLGGGLAILWALWQRGRSVSGAQVGPGRG